ncbi:hypothetical protein BH20ACI3_BH20ACI3_17810 [soil metagenome]
MPEINYPLAKISENKRRSSRIRRCCGRSPNNQRNSLDGRAKPILTTGGEAVTKPSINSGEIDYLSPQKVEMDNQLPPKKNLKEALSLNSEVEVWFVTI